MTATNELEALLELEGQDAQEEIVETPVEEKQEVVEEIQEETPDVDGGVNLFKEITGFDGELEYSIEGFAKAAKELVDKSLEGIDDEVKEFVEWKKLGGDLESFKQVRSFPDWDSFLENLTEDSDDLERVIYAEYEKTQDSEDIAELIEKWKDKGVLFGKAKKIVENWSATTKQEKENYAKSVREQTEQNKQQFEKTLSEIQGVITKNNFQGFSIPKNEIKEFSELYKPSQKGLPIDDIYRGLTIEQNALVDYLAWKVKTGKPIMALNNAVETNKKLANGTRTIPLKKTFPEIEQFEGSGDLDFLLSKEKQLRNTI